MSEERYCVLCHKQVWFGAYGTTQEHVDYSDNPEFYESREKVCVECIEILKKLPIIKKEEDIIRCKFCCEDLKDGILDYCDEECKIRGIRSA